MEMRHRVYETEYMQLSEGGAIKSHINIILTAHPIWTKEHSDCSELISMVLLNDRGTRLDICWSYACTDYLDYNLNINILLHCRTELNYSGIVS